MRLASRVLSILFAGVQLQAALGQRLQIGARGAVAVKIWKEVGIEIKNRDGKFILPDDPLFDPIYAHLAKVGKPLHAHLAEPIVADPHLITVLRTAALPAADGAGVPAMAKGQVKSNKEVRKPKAEKPKPSEIIGVPSTSASRACSACRSASVSVA